MRLINRLLATSSIVIAGLSSISAVAGPVSSTLKSCALGSVTVTSVKLAADGSSVPLSLPIDYKNCYGAFAGNDTPYPTTNLGYLDDGLLNGQPQKFQGPGTGGDLFGNGAFLNDPYAPYDLNGDGKADPGWVFLGKIENPATGTFQPVGTIGGVGGIVLSSFFSASYDSAAKVWHWAFTPDKDVAARAGVVLGDNYFDQFALVFKQSDGFAAYNFTGEQFGVTHPDADDPILNFYGTADVSKVFGSKGLSHISLWARDPGFANNVPEPGSLALVGVALLGLVMRRKKAL